MQYLYNVNFIVKAVLCFLIFGGIIYLIRKDLSLFYIWQKEYRFSKMNTVKIKKNESEYDHHIRYILLAVFGKNTKISVLQFKAFSLFLLLFFLALCTRQMSFIVAIPISFTIASMPYIYIRLRLLQLRNRSSHEAEQLISEMIAKYRMKNFNVEETIESVLTSKNVKVSKPLLSKLLIKLRTSRNDKEIFEATNIFAYSIGTNWAKILASNIYQANKFGINISLSLEDILINLREARILQEERSRNTSEPRRMMYFIPISYLLLFVMSVWFVGIDVKHFLYNQFGTKEGLTIFCLCMIGLMISNLFLIFISNKKLDY